MEVMRHPAKGNMYVLRDTATQYLRDMDKTHNYIIISDKNNQILGSDQGYVECMCITSQKNHDIKWEIPIITPNGTIGYIAPYNIFSYDLSEFQQNKWRGTIVDTEWGTVEEFLQFLMEIYLYTRHLSTKIKPQKLLRKMNEYRGWFRDAYPLAEEYRYASKFDLSRIYHKPSIDDKDATDTYLYKGEAKKDDDFEHVIEIKPKVVDELLDEIKADEDGTDPKEPQNDEVDLSEVIYSDEFVQESETVYSDGDITPTIDIPTNIVDMFKKEEPEDEEPGARVITVKTKKNMMKYKERASTWDVNTAIQFINDIEEVGVATMAKELHCTQSAVYQKRRVARAKMKG